MSIVNILDNNSNAVSIVSFIIESPPVTILPQQKSTFNIGGEQMPENIVDFLDKIATVKGQEYVEGLVAGVNLITPEPEETGDADAN